MIFDFDNTYVRDLPELATEWKAAGAPNPELVAFNAELADEISADGAELESDEGIAILAGNLVPDGAQPVAMAYAGHQFGGYSPRLGDGRALLLGEVIDDNGQRVDIHLKGSGRTPYARGGDGKASIGPMLREFLIAEAVNALGIPTGRALAVVTTGEQVMRDRPEPGALLTRVAASHLRVGSFEYAVRLPPAAEDSDQPTILQRLADYAIARHYPEAAQSEQPYLTLFERVAEAQASLVAQWMLVGFIHGVMNTDNTTISGQTIDYGPCAFMDRFDQGTVYSSIDHQGRYAYGNQPTIVQWNLARLAETLIPLVSANAGVEPEEAVPLISPLLEAFPQRFSHYWEEGMAAKLGLLQVTESDPAFFADTVELLQTQRVDYTNFFRSLASWLRDDSTVVGLDADLSADRAAIDQWLTQWRKRLDDDGRPASDVADAMDQVNPIYIPRNHLVDEALEAANHGDYTLFGQLLDVVTEPFDEQDGQQRYALPAPEGFDQTFRTFCGT